MEGKKIIKNGRVYTIFPECLYLIKKEKIIKNRYDKEDEGFIKKWFFCTKLQKTIKKKYCKGCMLYKPIDGTHNES